MSRFPFPTQQSNPYGGQRRSNIKMRLIIAAVIALFAILSGLVEQFIRICRKLGVEWKPHATLRRF